MKVSICIPAYNQTKYLKKLLDSIVQQNFTDYEVIITDDSTTNDVGNLVKEYFSLIYNLRYFQNTSSLGTPENWNEAIRKASGEYIKIMHHDDWFTDENSLGEFINMMDNNPDALFGFTGACQFDEGTDKIIKKRCTKRSQFNKILDNPYLLIGQNVIGAPSNTIIHKDLAAIKYDNKLIWDVDCDYFLRVIENSKRVAMSQRYLISRYKETETQVTSHCKNDASIQLGELLYLFAKYRKSFGIKNKMYFAYRYVERCNDLAINNFYNAKTHTNIKPPLLFLIMFQMEKLAKPLYDFISTRTVFVPRAR